METNGENNGMDCHLEEDDSADLVLYPITIDDIGSHGIYNANEAPTKPVVKIPVRKTSRLGENTSGKERRRRLSQMNVNRRHWFEAVAKIRNLADPWEKFHLDDYKTEIVVRHRYNTLRKIWVTDEVQVKMEPQPFNHGAMRECYRMRKISKTCHSNKWKTAANYVAKCYMDDVNRNVYFEDVMLQMDAKLWGEEFNRHNPPKKVDIFQVAILEFVNRVGSPLFHVEHFIEGRYIKYNSNSGYVNDEARLTPHAFSHFTFERSGHELIVVDIQGVGDLYTDPQIHTASGKEYGDGNLGTRGMALFFHSHECNIICESLGLSSFDLYTSEQENHQSHDSFSECSDTHIRGTEEICMLPSYYEKTHLDEFLRSRSMSSGSLSIDEISPPIFVTRTLSENSQGSFSENDVASDNDSGLGSFRSPRMRHDTDSGSITEEVDRQMFSHLVTRNSRPSCVQQEIELRKMREDVSRTRTGGSVLGQIHLDLAKYHELARFSSAENSYDKEAALFHLQHAADCDNLEAIINLSKIYLNLPHDILADVELEPCVENITKGIDYLQIAAEAGDKPSIIYLAQAYDTGYNLGSERKRSWKEAVYWYNEAVVTEENDESGHYDDCMDHPKYLLLARQADMYREGGYDLIVDLQRAGELYQEAADAATAAMRGRLASKYYMLAEELGGSMEE